MLLVVENPESKVKSSNELTANIATDTSAATTILLQLPLLSVLFLVGNSESNIKTVHEQMEGLRLLLCY